MSLPNNGSEASWPVLPCSVKGLRTSNPIRRILDQLRLAVPPEKEQISLALGDPTVFGNFPPPAEAKADLIDALNKGTFNGYAHSTGFETTRAAIAAKYSVPGLTLSSKDVIVTSGCSGALELMIEAVGNEGNNILIPCPGFSLYQTICDSCGVEARPYNLLPEQGWEADLVHLESQVDSKTSAILVNNPSNPCGSVYSEAHLRAILDVAERHKIPIISDEIYADMVFPGEKFFPIASLTSSVPILVAGGISKRFMVPGWRLGWVIMYDFNGALEQIRDGLVRLSTIIVGANTLMQAVVPSLLANDEEFLKTTMNKLHEHAAYCIDRLSRVRGLHCIIPRGAMYLMVGVDMSHFPGMTDDMGFVQQLVLEENVFVLPGQCFGMKNYFRIVYCPPISALQTAFDRMEHFCNKHYV